MGDIIASMYANVEGSRREKKLQQCKGKGIAAEADSASRRVRRDSVYKGSG